MNAQDLRNAIGKQCGFNKAKQGEKLPTSFSDWLASNQDSIELDRTEATCQWFDNKAKDEPLPF